MASGIGGPAPVTNGGTAMPVMRNFGYLGLQSVVHSKSSLARDRLVDFTGEVQIRRRNEQDSYEKDEPISKDLAKRRRSGKDADINVLPAWHKQFIAEPTVTVQGGRNLRSDGPAVQGNSSNSLVYALLPLHSSTSPRSGGSSSPAAKPHRGRQNSSGDDIESFYRTSFYNELLYMLFIQFI